ncbi:MAG: glycosyltransferase involved in cell wall biosynthesis [Desulforhopalus sp.]|jgi:glycosyltransferase involved in cell wall biosynthesis
MHILHIIDSGGMYGAEVMLLNLVEEQVRQGLKPVIASIGDKHSCEKPFETEACKRNFPIKIFRMRPGPNFIGAREILNFAKSIHCDLLHSHGYKGNILFGFIPKKIRRLPLITTLHGWTSSGASFSRMHLYELLDSWALSRMDAVVLVNKGMLAHSRLAGRDNIKFHIVNNGINVEEPESYPCAELKLRQVRDANIVAVGRLSPEKGFNVLLKAIARVVENGGDVSLVIFGEGRLRRKLEELILQLGLQGRVKMSGFVSNVAATFSCFDLLVMPSLTEGLPITLLEAMRGKLPVIASKVGGIPNVLEDGVGGILVEAGDEIGLAEAINQLVGSGSRCKQLAEEAHLIFKQRYSSTQMETAYRQIYTDTLVNSNKGASL